MELKKIEDIRNQDKTMLILIGVPGSGKSTWAAAHLDWCIASTDDIISRISYEYCMTYDEAFKELYPFAEKIFWRDIENYLNYEDLIVIDRTNLSAKSRKRLIDMAKKAGWNVGFIFFKTPEPDEWKERLNRPGKTIPPHVLESMAENIQFPSADEGFDFYLEA